VRFSLSFFEVRPVLTDSKRTISIVIGINHMTGLI